MKLQQSKGCMHALNSAVRSALRKSHDRDTFSRYGLGTSRVSIATKKLSDVRRVVAGSWPPEEFHWLAPADVSKVAVLLPLH